jgi:hypothetical protein
MEDRKVPTAQQCKAAEEMLSGEAGALFRVGEHFSGDVPEK